MVVLKSENVLVFCWLGDKDSISKAAFKKKVRQLKKANLDEMK